MKNNFNKTRTSVLIPLLDLFTTSESCSDAVTKSVNVLNVAKCQKYALLKCYSTYTEEKFTLYFQRMPLSFCIRVNDTIIHVSAVFI